MGHADSGDLAGTRLGRYQVVSLLGRGGMGAVYDAIDPTLDRHVALKILPSDVVADPGRLARFVTEARAASALNHPNVVSIYEIGEADGVHFIAMERVDGVTLRSICAAAPLRKPQAIAILHDVVSAVAAAHSAGVIHRDLKPENIMVAKGGYPKVLDFGLAKLRTADSSGSSDSTTAIASTASGVILGTPGYMSPEQAHGRPVDHRSDIFSLGCILYESISGRRAFVGQSQVETLHKVINDDPEPLSGPPDELHRIVRKAMAKDREERYQSAREMASDLRELSRELDRPKPVNERGWRRMPAIPLLAIAALLIAAAIVAILMRGRAERVRPQRALRVQRVTARGSVLSVAVSPDGKYAAYAALDNTLYLRQLATGQELELVHADGALWGQAFTRDGDAIVYGLRTRENPGGAFFRIATIGGRPEHLLDGMDSPPSFSPDGKRMTWVRAEFPLPMESSLMIANVDGSGVRALVTRKPPEKFAPCYFCGPSWSPDGKLIATSVARNLDPRTAELLTVDAGTGSVRSLVKGHWQSISQAAWLPDGNAIAFVGADLVSDLTQMQVWVAEFPSGVVHRVTNELVGYRGVSISADGQSLLTVGLDVSAQIWSVPLNGAAVPTKISRGKFDGWEGLVCTPDGRVVYTTIEDTTPALFIINADGSGRTPLTRDNFDNRLPAAFHDGIVYISSTPAGTDLCFVRFDGEGRRVIVHGVDVAPVAVTADGRTVVFERSRRLWTADMDGHTPPQQLLSYLSSSPSFSPTGDRVAFFTDDTGNYAAGVVVMNVADHRVVWRANLASHEGSAIRWVADGTALLINDGLADDMNLWRYDFHGQKQRLTNFVDQRAFFWDLLPDGKTAMVSRAAISRDAVRLTDFR